MTLNSRALNKVCSVVYSDEGHLVAAADLPQELGRVRSRPLMICIVLRPLKRTIRFPLSF